MGASKVTTDDLLLAIDWLESYESGEDDTVGESLARVGEWLENEVRRRAWAAAERSMIREVAAQNGVDPSDPRLRRVVKQKMREARGRSEDNRGGPDGTPPGRKRGYQMQQWGLTVGVSENTIAPKEERAMRNIQTLCEITCDRKGCRASVTLIENDWLHHGLDSVLCDQGWGQTPDDGDLCPTHLARAEGRAA